MAMTPPHRGPSSRAQGLVRLVTLLLIVFGAVAPSSCHVVQSRRISASHSGTRRSAQEEEEGGGQAEQEEQAEEPDWSAACLDLEQLPPGTQSKPLYNYCTCAPRQEKDFSTPDVEEWFSKYFVTGKKRGNLKLLMLGMGTAQLTGARSHLAESMLLAKAFKRSLVLNNAGGSGLVFDRRMPLCAYFNTQEIGEFVNWVSQRALFKWMEQYKLSVAPLFLLNKPLPCNSSLWDYFPVQRLGRKTPLFRAMDEALSEGNAACMVHAGHADVAADRLADLLSSAEHRRLRQSDVIVVMKAGRHSFFAPRHMKRAIRHVDYSPHLKSIARRMEKAQLGPPLAPTAQASGTPAFVAVHWRVGQALALHRVTSSATSVDELLTVCAESLVAEAQEQSRALGGAPVFLASDVDADAPAGRSFAAFAREGEDSAEQRESANKAIKLVHEKLRPITWRHVEPLFPLLDNGMQAILDKMVCMQATHFVYAPPNCGGEWSSFTGEIIQARTKQEDSLPSSSWANPAL